jgi:hypothetical protein
VLAHAPDYWLVNQGTNDGSANIGSLVQTRISQARVEAGPATQILILVPFNGAERTAITANYNAYVAANPSDKNVHLIDLGSISYTTSDGTILILLDTKRWRPPWRRQSISPLLLFPLLPRQVARQSLVHPLV